MRKAPIAVIVLVVCIVIVVAVLVVPTPGPIGVRPNEPQGLTAVSGNGYVSLSWQSPAQAGSAPISSYRVYRSAEQFVAEKEMMKQAILGLKPAFARNYGLSKKQLQRMKRAINGGKDACFNKNTMRRLRKM